MEDDKENPGSRKSDGDDEKRAPTLGQSTPFVEGDCSNTQLLYFLLNRKAATRPSTSPAGVSTPAMASSSVRDSTPSTAPSSLQVSTPAMASSSVRDSTPSTAPSSLQVSTPAMASSSARDSTPSTALSLAWVSTIAMASSLARVSPSTAASSSVQVSTSAVASPSDRFSTPIPASSTQFSTPATASSSARVSPPTTASSSARDTQYRFVQEVGSEEKDMHPRNILKALGEDLSGQKSLRDHYHFYAWTRYPVNKVVVTRNRMTGGCQCWSQGGGKESVRNDKEDGKHQDSIIGWKRKFNFVGNPGKRPIESIQIGSQSYTFKLEELVTAEDEEEEKLMMGEKQTPRSFLCIYRLKPTLKSTIEHHQSCRVANPGPDDRNSPLVLPSSAQPPTGQQDLQLPQASSWHDLQSPNVDSGIDHLLHFFLADEPFNIGIDHLFQSSRSTDLGHDGQNCPPIFPSSAQALTGKQASSSLQQASSSSHDPQSPIVDSSINYLQSWLSAHPGPGGQNSPLVLSGSAQPLAGQQDLQWPQEPSLQYPLYLLVLPTLARTLTGQQDIQSPQASSLHNQRSNVGHFRVGDLQSCGSADPGPSGQDSPLDLPSSGQPGQALQLPQAPLDAVGDFYRAMEENHIDTNDGWNFVELIYKPKHMLYDQGWFGPFHK